MFLTNKPQFLRCNPRAGRIILPIHRPEHIRPPLRLIDLLYLLFLSP